MAEGNMIRSKGKKIAGMIIGWVFIILAGWWILSNWTRQDWIFVIALIVVAILALVALIKIVEWRDETYKQGYEQGKSEQGKSEKR